MRDEDKAVECEDSEPTTGMNHTASVHQETQMCKDKRTGPEAPGTALFTFADQTALRVGATAAASLWTHRRQTHRTIWGLPLPTGLRDYVEEYKFQVELEKIIAVAWNVLQPLLFGLIGAEVSITSLRPETVGLTSDPYMSLC
nr:uncharacterized protein LOC109730136 isoform X1 [Microcebus murinus]